MNCDTSNTLNITGCFVPSLVTRCNIGDFCTVQDSLYNSNCSFTGMADQYFTKLISNSFKCFTLSKICIPSEIIYANAKCDFLMGMDYNDGNLSDRWMAAGIYNTETISALYASDVSYGPWDFLTPFTTSLWITILCIMFILTPLIMSFVEYDEEETIWDNFWKFLPDSIHAHTGIDLVNNDLPTKNTSYLLSVFISVFSFIILTLYASNLIAFVLYKNSGSVAPVFGLLTQEDSSIFVEESLMHLINITNAVEIQYYNIPMIHASGLFDVIVAEDFFLDNIKTCDETVRPLRGIGNYKYLIVSSNFGKENIETIIKTMRTMDYMPRVYRDACESLPAIPIELGGIYGVFILFFVPAILIAIMVIIRRVAFKHIANPYITSSS